MVVAGIQEFASLQVEWLEEENYKFKLSSFVDPIRSWLEQDPCPVTPRM